LKWDGQVMYIQSHIWHWFSAFKYPSC
jgi:hypothetical protein